jgi:ABC-type phosphate transport system substrate-binding protein
VNKSAFFATASLLLVTGSAYADTAYFKGSDTLFGVVTDAVNVSGLATELQYLGGGSGTGEAGLLSGTQGIAPMSRAPSADALTTATSKGIVLTSNVIGLDGVSLFTKATNATTRLDIPIIRSIFGGVDGTGSAVACADAARITNWQQIAGSNQTGLIRKLRRNDDSGTTDTFRALVGVKAFCADTVTITSTAEIAQETSSDPSALGFAGLSALRPTLNKDLAIGTTAAGPFVLPGESTLRDFTYPLARRLYVVVASGAVVPSEAENALLVNLLDRSFLDPIVTANEFITCAATGCP